jgi:hypothetical protein
MLNVILLNVFLPNVILPNVFLLNVIAPVCLLYFISGIEGTYDKYTKNSTWAFRNGLPVGDYQFHKWASV